MKKFVFLIPNECKNKAEDEIKDIKDIKDIKGRKIDDYYVQLTWGEVTEMLTNLLEKESKGNISPISDYARQTIKAFIYYISHRNDKVIKNKEAFKKDKEHYYLIQYSNYQADLYKQEDMAYKLKSGQIFKTLKEYIGNDFEIPENCNTQHLVDLFIKYLRNPNSVAKKASKK